MIPGTPVNQTPRGPRDPVPASSDRFTRPAHMIGHPWERCPVSAEVVGAFTRGTDPVDDTRRADYWTGYGYRAVIRSGNGDTFTAPGYTWELAPAHDGAPLAGSYSGHAATRAACEWEVMDVLFEVHLAGPNLEPADDMPVSSAPVYVATRATRAAAAEHYAAGGTVAVSVNGEATFPVTDSTVTHSLTHGVRSWPELAATVDSYGDTRQRFYIVTGGE